MTWPTANSTVRSRGKSRDSSPDINPIVKEMPLPDIAEEVILEEEELPTESSLSPPAEEVTPEESPPSKERPQQQKCGTCNVICLNKLLSVYITVILLGRVTQLYVGLNETMISAMQLNYNYYGVINGQGPVYTSTHYGALKGFKSVSRDGKEFHQFLGIPYAAAPIGELRFKLPVPPQPWEGILDATGFGNICTQYDVFLQAAIGREDCLTLNIFSPKGTGKPMPVLVYIHGGMFMFGRSLDFLGDYFIEEDIIVVTINYRLQAFGFLNTGDGVVRGNMGLKDQVLALEWVQQNIIHFGGNANDVTLWGESAGGVSALLHTLSENSKGLFHRVITNSGPTLAHWAHTRNPAEQFRTLANALGCKGSTEETVDCLKQIPSDVYAEYFRITHDVLRDRIHVFGPTVESGPKDKDTFLSEHPRELLRKGNIVSKVPMIAGVNSNEGLIYAGYFVRNETVAYELNNNWYKHAPVLFDYEDLPPHKKNSVSFEIRNYYFGNKTITMDTINETVDLFSDTSFFKPMEESVHHFAKRVPVYPYMYSHKGEFGVAQAYFRVSLKLPILFEGLFATGVQVFNKHVLGIEEKHYGACHADELALLFKMHPLLSNIHTEHKEYHFSKEMVRQWAHFVKFGEPAPFQGRKWQRAQPNQPLKYMVLDSIQTPGLIEAPWKTRVQFLNNLTGMQCMDPADKGAVCF